MSLDRRAFVLPTPHPIRRGCARLLRGFVTLVRFCAAAAAVGLLLAGTPYLLHYASPRPWPEHRRSLQEIWAALQQPYTDQLLIDTLVGIGWLGWAGFCLSVLFEGLWHIRNFPVLLRDFSEHRRHQEHVGALRWPAAALIGLLVVALIALMRATHAATVTTSAVPAVRPPAVVAALSHDQSYEPVPARDTGADAPAESEERLQYTVVPGDTLWEIAKDRLGDPLRWPEIYGLNKHVRQTDGGRLTDPDLIYPGWVLQLPADAEAWEKPLPAPPAPEDPPPVPQAPPSAPPPSADEQPAPPAPSEAPSIPAPREGIVPVPTDTPESGRSSGRPVGIDLPVAGFIGVTTAAGLAAALFFARAHRRRRAAPDLTERAERHPLASLLPIAEEAPEPTFDDGPGLQFPSPADDASDGDTAALNPPLRRRPAPAPPRPPGEIVVGARHQSEVALTEVVGATGLGLTGDGAPAVARAIIANVLTAAERMRPRPPQTRIVLTEPAAAAILALGTATDVLAALPTVDLVGDTAAAIAQAQRHQLACERNALDTALAAVEDGAPGRLVLLLSAAADDSTQTHALAALARDTRIDLVVLGDWPVVYQVNTAGSVAMARGSSRAVVDGLRLHHLSVDQLEEVVELVRAAHGYHEPSEEEEVPAPALVALDDALTYPVAAPPSLAAPVQPPTVVPALPVPDPTPVTGPASRVRQEASRAPGATEPRPLPTRSDGTEEHTRPALLTLHVLGGFHLEAQGRVATAGNRISPDTREFLALLVAHPAGVPQDELIDALRISYGDDGGQAELQRVRRAARRLLHDNVTAGRVPPLIQRSGERLRLHPVLVDSDLRQLNETLASAARATGPERVAGFEAVVHLYGGPFMDGFDYVWASPLRRDLQRRVTDTLVLLGDHYAEGGDIDLALLRYQQATRMDPTNEPLYRRILRLQIASHRSDAAYRTYDELCVRLADIDASPDKETRALMHGLRDHPDAAT